MQDTGAPHETLAAACVQPLAPLQVPVLPQGGLAVHWPAGAAVPAASGVQVPGEVPAQVWHVPHAGLPQQTLLTQLPLMHWLPAVHAVPGGLSPQFRFPVVPRQVFGARQCVSIAQLLRQVVPPHMYGLQLDDVAVAQPPVPLQCEIGVYVDPEHVSVPHDTVVAASWQPPAPLHAPVFPQVGLGVQRFIGSMLPSGTFVQVPAFTPTLQAWHSGHELLAQQTPSTQE